MKKITAIILLCALTLSVLSGCGGEKAGSGASGEAASKDADSVTSQDGGTAKDVTLSILHHYDEESVRDWLSEITKNYTEETGTKFDIQATGYDNYQTLIKTKISSGDAADVFTLGVQDLPVFTENNYIADLTDEKLWDNIVDGLKQSTAYNGKNYYIPFEPTACGAIYNKDTFKEAGIEKLPETYSEFIAMLKKIKEAGIIPVAVGSQEWWTIVNDYRCDQLAYLLKKDPQWMTKKEKRESKFVDDADFMKSLEMFKERYEYVQDDPFGTNWNKATQLVATGKASMVIMGNFAIGSIRDKVSDVNMGMFPVPVNENPDDTVMPTFTTAGYVAYANSPKIKEAVDFIRYLVSPESGNIWAEKTGRMSNIKGVTPSSDSTIADITKYQEAGKCFDISAMQIDFTQEFTTAQVDVFTKYLLGQIKTTKEAAELLDQKFDEIANK